MIKTKKTNKQEITTKFYLQKVSDGKFTIVFLHQKLVLYRIRDGEYNGKVVAIEAKNQTSSNLHFSRFSICK